MLAAGHNILRVRNVSCIKPSLRTRGNDLKNVFIFLNKRFKCLTGVRSLVDMVSGEKNIRGRESEGAQSKEEGKVFS